MECQLHIRISKSLHDEVIEIAQAEDVPPAVIARRAIKRFVEEYRRTKAGALELLQDKTRRPRGR
jgi:predicted transcriptional regulator